MDRYEPATLSKDVAYDLVTERQRRVLIDVLLAGANERTVDELTDAVAAREHDVGTSEIDETTRKRVSVSLLHRHLPKLADAGVVDFEFDTETVVVKPALEDLKPLV